jgi:hypothetical protein
MVGNAGEVSHDHSTERLTGVLLHLVEHGREGCFEP